MPNVHQMISVYLQILSTHLQNNATLWETYVDSSNLSLQSEFKYPDELINIWMNRHIEINHQFADQLFQATLNFHAEALRFFDKQLLPPTLSYLTSDQN